MFSFLIGVLRRDRLEPHVDYGTLEEVLPPIWLCVHGKSPSMASADADTRFLYWLFERKDDDLRADGGSSQRRFRREDSTDAA
jgi:hypothetical protein